MILTPQNRNGLLNQVFEQLNMSEDYYLGFNYNNLKQTGSCNCVITDFARVPAFSVKHHTKSTSIMFLTHHGHSVKVSVSADNMEDVFKAEFMSKIREKLQPFQNDWN